MYSTRSFSELMHEKTIKDLIFIHTPKCGGSYVATILSHLNIKNKGHTQANPHEHISFTVIRNPVERFESLLNYRLCEKTPRNDWPKHLSYVYQDKTVQLNEIVSQMSNEEILGFSPYKTLTYWTKNVDIIITIDNLPKMLGYFDYTYDINLFKPVNVSTKTRGHLDQHNKDRIAHLFNDDMVLYNMVTNSSF